VINLKAIIEIFQIMKEIEIGNRNTNEIKLIVPMNKGNTLYAYLVFHYDANTEMFRFSYVEAMGYMGEKSGVLSN